MATLSGHKYRWVFIAWVLIGIFVAWERTYIAAGILKLVLSTLLAIFLWPLVLLGISLHIR
jgi:hypothetical protein